MADMTKNSSARPLLAVAVAAGFTGAVVGGTVAVAKNLHQVRKGTIQKGEAVKSVLGESAGAGVATASAAAVVGVSGLGNSLLGLVGFVGVAAGTKYLWDSVMLPDPADARVTEEKVPETGNGTEPSDKEKCGEKCEASEHSGEQCADTTGVEAGTADVEADMAAGPEPAGETATSVKDGAKEKSDSKKKKR